MCKTHKPTATANDYLWSCIEKPKHCTLNKDTATEVSEYTPTDMLIRGRLSQDFAEEEFDNEYVANETFDDDNMCLACCNTMKTCRQVRRSSRIHIPPFSFSSTPQSI